MGKSLLSSLEPLDVEDHLAEVNAELLISARLIRRSSFSRYIQSSKLTRTTSPSGSARSS